LILSVDFKPRRPGAAEA
jgi:hypothetical protein